MQAVEINAGAWYLRALRADTRLSDVPALADLGLTAEAVTEAERSWADQSACTWAVCEPTTGELVALLIVSAPDGGDPARFAGRAREGGQAALSAAQEPVRRFVTAALGWPLADS